MKRNIFIVMAYVILSSQVVIGNIKFKAVNSIEINKSIHTISDDAVVRLPRAMTKEGKDIVKALEIGQPVEIRLGYNEILKTEFKGYLKHIGDETPLVLEFEDEAYKMRGKPLNEAFPEITLKKLLQTIAPDYEIECPEVNLGKFEIDNANAFRLLQELQKQYGFYTFFNDKKLKVGYPYMLRDGAKTHIYDFQKYAKRDKSKLKYVEAKDKKVLIRAIANKKNGKKVIKEFGDTDGSVRTLNYGDIDEGQLLEYAEQTYNRLNFDGWEGNIVGFGIPRTNPGDAIEIIDADYPKRQGKYLIDDVKVRWGNAYFERINNLSFKI